MNKPNIILCITDDQGWGDTGYNGNPVARTPHLDRMAAEGLRFDRFYSAAPVCSPTRASCLTGRNPYRTGVFFANEGILRPEEFTLMKFVKSQGYTTGHFGKWHLGTLTKTEKDANRGRPGNDREYNPPWEHGFDVCFSTESKVPTWDPMKKPLKASGSGWQVLKPGEEFKAYGTHYWNEKGRKISDNTMLWFCSDNGPEGQASADTGTTGPFRGRKRDLYEGGVRVPGILVWPERIKKGRTAAVPCVTSDYFPTIMDALGQPHGECPIDGESILPLIQGKPFERNTAIGFKSQHRFAWNAEQYKLYAEKWGGGGAGTLRLESRSGGTSRSGS